MAERMFSHFGPSSSATRENRQVGAKFKRACAVTLAGCAARMMPRYVGKRAALLGDVLGELGRTWKLRAVPDINDQDRLVALVDEVKKAVRLDDKLA